MIDLCYLKFMFSLEEIRLTLPPQPGDRAAEIAAFCKRTVVNTPSGRGGVTTSSTEVRERDFRHVILRQHESYVSSRMTHPSGSSSLYSWTKVKGMQSVLPRGEPPESGITLLILRAPSRR